MKSTRFLLICTAVASVFIALASVSLHTTTANAHLPDTGHALKYVFVAENAVLSLNTDADHSDYVAGLAHLNGFNGMRVDLVWRPDSTDPNKGFLTGADAMTALCNAAQALVKADVPNLMIDIRPGASNWPQTDDDRQALTSYAEQAYATLENPTPDANGNVGCVSGKPLNILMEIGNEVNIGGTFCSPESDTDHKQCAAEYIQEQAMAYRALKAQAASFKTQITVMGCSLAPHHTPFGFDVAVKAAIDAYHLKGPFWDLCDFHPYHLVGSLDPQSGFSLYPQLVESLKSTYGQAGPICYGEVGFETNNTPASKGYYGNWPYGPLVLSEFEQGQAWAQAIQNARQQGVPCIGNFHLIDECSLTNGFQSGMYYCNLTPSDANPAVAKKSQPAFLQANQGATQP